MKKPKNIKKLLIVLLHLLGFPLLLITVLINAKLIIQNGKSYGIFAFAGILLIAVFMIVYYVILLIMVKRKKSSPIKQGIILSIVSMLLFAGVFVFLSKAAPDKLLQITSGTISYEDLTGQYNERAKINKLLLDDFIYLNTFGNGNLVYVDSKTPDESNKNYIVYKVTDKTLVEKDTELKLATNLEEIKKLDEKKYRQELDKWIIAKQDAYNKYSKKGFKDKRIQQLSKGMFHSLDGDGFKNFSGPWMDFAAANVITIPALVHLLLDAKSHTPAQPFPALTSKGLRQAPVKWSVLDMMGPPLGVSGYEYKDTINGIYNYKLNLINNNKNLSKEQKNNEINKIDKERFEKLEKAEYNNVLEVPSMAIDLALIKNPIISDLFASSPKFVNGVYKLIHDVATHDGVVGAPLYVSIDPNAGKVGLSGASVRRGVLGYQHSAWLDANNMIYLLISVFSTRVISILFCGYIIFMSLMTGLLRQNKIKAEKITEKEVKEKALNDILKNDNEDDILFKNVVPSKLIKEIK